MYKHSIRLTVFVCLLLCGKVLYAGNESISVTAKPHKNILLIGEPLYISSSIKNNGKSSIELHYAGGPRYSVYEGSWASVLISEDGETYRGWHSGTLRVIEDVAPVKLKPGQEHLNKFTVLYGGYGWDEKSQIVFHEEKPYFACVEYLFRQQEEKDFLRVRSTPFRIDVTKPEGEDLRLWNKLQVDTKYAEIVQGPEEITLQQDELDRLSDLCEKYPKTIYAPYLALSLGRYYYAQTWNWGYPGKPYIKDEVERNKIKALRYLEMVHSVTKNQTLREKADIILKRLRPTENIIVREKGTEIVIKGEYLLSAISDIIDHTGVEMNIEEISELDYVWEKRGKYSFKVKVKKGDKEEMLKIAKEFLKEALTMLKLTKKIAIKEKDGTLYLVPR